MRRVKVTIPAACTNLGPAIDSLGLALALHNTVEMSLRADSQSIVVARGEGRSAYPPTHEHPVMQGAAALYRALERPLPSVDVICTGEIPVESGLAAHAAWIIGGLFAANNLLETPLHRDRLAELACQAVERPVEAITALLGSMVLFSGGDQPPADMIYRRVELAAALKVVLVVPEIAGYRARMRAAVPQQVGWREMVFDLGRAVLLSEALRKGELALIGQVVQDHVLDPRLRALIPGYEGVEMAVRREGALALTVSGNGPALVIFAKVEHERIGEVAQAAFRAAGITARTWVLNIDTQGIAINVQKS